MRAQKRVCTLESAPWIGHSPTTTNHLEGRGQRPWARPDQPSQPIKAACDLQNYI